MSDEAPEHRFTVRVVATRTLIIRAPDGEGARDRAEKRVRQALEEGGVAFDQVKATTVQKLSEAEVE